MKKLSWIPILILLNGCTLPLILGHLEFTDFNKTYEFNFSKEKLKDKIIDLYSYKKGLLIKNADETLTESAGLIERNSNNRQSTIEWWNKTNSDSPPYGIRKSLGDTVDVHIVNQPYRKSIYLKLIIDGDDKNSTLRIMNVTAIRRNKFSKPIDSYKKRITRKIKNKFIDRLD